jgi:NADH-quinone oxidoreductase subunit J
MMLDIDFAALRSGIIEHAPVGALVGLVLAVELIVVIGGSTLSPEIASQAAHPIPPIAERTNTAALGDVLYTRYVYYFQVAGLVLLIAMIGAIVLTLRHKPNVKRQTAAVQIGRTRAQSIEVVKVASGQGLEQRLEERVP